MMTGPPLEEGPLPAIIYFALSAEESLQLDPFDQPVKALQNEKVRIFSFTLPHHENQQRDLSKWTEEIVADFVRMVKAKIPDLNASEVGVMGLSRGAMMACRLAAICPEIKHVLGFAPYSKFLDNIEDHLYDRSVRFYIGNLDTRVGTRECFDITQKLSKKAQENQIRSPPIELIVTPSIGFKGHGTSKAIFEAGAHWLKEQLHV
ncbi:MAG: hypothetical protein SP1CHLAM54_01830 [Chlamydiia bacterium]|nr:hypothetical protein [Chlamydiia bacterium]MCH9615101.1 hypothetical protein [Chlamydiia bacterium]MCH9628577.1 hypothetical protein [Chlamydiia bacterium]